jgi:hypothetical protein
VNPTCQMVLTTGFGDESDPSKSVLAILPSAGNYFSLAYSDLAAMRMGMSASAFFHSVKKS